ncbi:MAG: arginine--tRNA ligase [Methanobacteriota archaeon]|nr:MAG: arginine--tRNA ligase [Euryarchaeota archaeon]
MIEDIRQEIRRALAKAVQDAFQISKEEEGISVEIQSNPKFGEFSSSVCFELARETGKTQKEVAEAILSKFEKPEMVEDIEVLEARGMHYLDFFLDFPRFGTNVLRTVLESKDDYGKSDKYKGEKLLLEHSSINPTGPINVGRVRNSLIGDALARLSGAVGWDVETHFYVDDMGRQVATIAWGVENKVVDNYSLSFDERGEPELEKTDGSPKNELVSRYQKYAEKPDFKIFFTYVPTTKLIEEEELEAEIDQLAEKSEEGDEESIQKLKKVVDDVLAGQKETLERLGITFDSFDFESKFVLDGSAQKAIDDLRELPQTLTLDTGAYAIDLSEFGLERRGGGTVFQRPNGTSVYIVRDTAYHRWKLGQADKNVIVLGEDHKVEFKELKTILKLLGDLKSDELLEVSHYAFVGVKGRSLSTRKGVIVSVDELMDEGIEKAEDEVRKRNEDLDDGAVAGIARQVAIGAIKYHMLKVQAMKPFTFSWDEALDFEGDAAPYVQYAHARASSILRKGEIPEDGPLPKEIAFANEQEKNLARLISHFPSIVLTAAETRRPHMLPEYAYRLATLFTEFYHASPVLAADSEDIKESRIAMVKATKQTLKNCLALLGIESPERM